MLVPLQALRAIMLDSTEEGTRATNVYQILDALREEVAAARHEVFMPPPVPQLSEESVEGAIQEHRDVGDFPLLAACRLGSWQDAERLLTSKADVCQMKWLDGSFPLLEAVDRDHKAVVKLLLHHGASPNQQNNLTGEFPLIIAARKGYADTLEALIEADADPNQVHLITGELPLVEAVKCKSIPAIPIVKSLLAARAEPGMLDEETGDFPLLVAAATGNMQVAQLLLMARANPRQTSRCTGKTPLHVAAEAGHVGMVAMLSKAGASLDAVIGGVTPEQASRDAGHLALAELIRKATEPEQRLPLLLGSAAISESTCRATATEEKAATIGISTVTEDWPAVVWGSSNPDTSFTQVS
eukprot:TRINITY_DN8968_c1_g1_i1.p1 TRINITY_DN8968_c1_g1~~TRINITY_DN8968_c1_g1_i1.p1  ORF type:complete len:356 (+),score=75.53 TRINITY_DN8968_c1_g1_i1:66-1133(+)